MISYCLKNSAGQVDLRLGARRAAAHDEAAARLERPHRLAPRRRADALDDDVGADVPALARRVDRRHRTHRQGGLALGRAAARRHDLGAEVAGDRQRRAGHAGPDADDEHGLTGGQAGAPQHPVGGERGQRVGGALLPAAPGRVGARRCGPGRRRGSRARPTCARRRWRTRGPSDCRCRGRRCRRPVTRRG